MHAVVSISRNAYQITSRKCLVPSSLKRLHRSSQKTIENNVCPKKIPTMQQHNAPWRMTEWKVTITYTGFTLNDQQSVFIGKLILRENIISHTDNVWTKDYVSWWLSISHVRVYTLFFFNSKENMLNFK